MMEKGTSFILIANKATKQLKSSKNIQNIFLITTNDFTFFPDSNETVT